MFCEAHHVRSWASKWLLVALEAAEPDCRAGEGSWSTQEFGGCCSPAWSWGFLAKAGGAAWLPLAVCYLQQPAKPSCSCVGEVLGVLCSASSDFFL